LDADHILAMRELVSQILVSDDIKHYILRLVFATREPENYAPGLENLLRVGASPRATINLTLAARAHAFLNGRAYVDADDVKAVAPDVIQHRVILSYEAEAEGLTQRDFVERLLASVKVP
jgi:MoxR-like ATPase